MFNHNGGMGMGGQSPGYLWNTPNNLLDGCLILGILKEFGRHFFALHSFLARWQGQINRNLDAGRKMVLRSYRNVYFSCNPCLQLAGTPTQWDTYHVRAALMLITFLDVSVGIAPLKGCKRARQEASHIVEHLMPQLPWQVFGFLSHIANVNRGNASHRGIHISSKNG